MPPWEMKTERWKKTTETKSQKLVFARIRLLRISRLCLAWLGWVWRWQPLVILKRRTKAGIPGKAKAKRKEIKQKGSKHKLVEELEGKKGKKEKKKRTKGRKSEKKKKRK